MLTSLAYIYIFGLLLGYIFKKFSLPPLIGMLFTGIILGPYSLNLLDDKTLLISPELRQLALVIILTRAGLALDLQDLKKVGRPAILMSFLPACFEILGCLLFAPMLLGISRMEAALLGTVIAAVSPAVIVPKMLSLMDSGKGIKIAIPQMILAAGSVDDVLVIVLFSVFAGLVAGGEMHITDFTQIPISIVTAIGAGIGIGTALVKYFRMFHLRDTIKVIIILSTAFLLISLENKLKGIFPISGLLAVMTLNATIFYKYQELAQRLSAKFTKLWVAAELLLFVLVGATVNIEYALAAGLMAIALIAVSLIFRMAGVAVSVLATPLNLKERIFTMVAYTPKATVQAAIGSVPLAMGLECGSIVLTIAVLAILITAPLGAMGIDALSRNLE